MKSTPTNGDTYTVFLGGDKTAKTTAGTIVASEKVTQYTIKFMDGETELQNQKYNEGETVTAPTPSAKDGYTFKGWATSATSTETVTVPATATADATYYAVWEEQSASGDESLITESMITVSDITNPYELGADKKIVKISTGNAVDPTTQTITIKGVKAHYTNYNNTIKFVAVVSGNVSVSDVVVGSGTSKRIYYGNLNGTNDELAATNVTVLVNAIIGNRAITDNMDYLVLDVNGDGSLAATDVTVMVNKVIGNTTELPCVSK